MDGEVCVQTENGDYVLQNLEKVDENEMTFSPLYIYKGKFWGNGQRANLNLLFTNKIIRQTKKRGR